MKPNIQAANKADCRAVAKGESPFIKPASPDSRSFPSLAEQPVAKLTHLPDA